MLTHQEMIAILAGVDDFEIIARKEKTLFAVRRVDDMDGPRSGPSRRYEIDQPPIRRELQVIERGDDVFGLLGRARARKAGRLLAVDADLPKLGRLAVLDIATGDRRTVDQPMKRSTCRPERAAARNRARKSSAVSRRRLPR
jgi:hypothetical protein